MIIVTGGAGFIGSNLIRKLNKLGAYKIIVVDNIKKNKKNLKYINFEDFYDKDNFLHKVKNNRFSDSVDLIIHLGACSDTTENNWDYLKYNNIFYSKELYKFSIKKNCQFVYASSASIYGKHSGYKISNKLNYRPLNLYGKTKLELDNFFFKSNKKKVTSLRYFNVYGNFEKHKGNMRSPISKFHEQLRKKNIINVFKFPINEEPCRDFINVKDAVDMTLFYINKKKYGIYNIGTGVTNTFIQVAELMIKNFKRGKIDYIKFPNILKNKYQFYTKANISEIKKIGYTRKFLSLEKGIRYYLENFNKYKN